MSSESTPPEWKVTDIIKSVFCSYRGILIVYSIRDKVNELSGVFTIEKAERINELSNNDTEFDGRDFYDQFISEALSERAKQKAVTDRMPFNFTGKTMKEMHQEVSDRVGKQIITQNGITEATIRSISDLTDSFSVTLEQQSATGQIMSWTENVMAPPYNQNPDGKMVYRTDSPTSIFMGNKPFKSQRLPF